MLEPHLARRGGEAAGGEERGEDAVNGAAATVQGGEEEYAAHGIEKSALHEAERAGIEPLHVLQVVAETEERRAGEHRKEGGGSPAHSRPRATRKSGTDHVFLALRRKAAWRL